MQVLLCRKQRLLTLNFSSTNDNIYWYPFQFICICQSSILWNSKILKEVVVLVVVVVVILLLLVVILCLHFHIMNHLMWIIIPHLISVLTQCHYIDIINILLLYKSFFHLGRARPGLNLYCKALVILTLQRHRLKPADIQYLLSMLKINDSLILC